METYTLEEWAELCSMTENDVREIWGADVIEFYAILDHPIAGCKHESGTYDIFGCNYDTNDVSYEDMVKYITEID